MSEAKWYVVHTYSGYENKVKVDLEKTIENRNLQDQILEVSVPMLAVTELKNGLEKQADKKMFPGYVLVKMVMNQDTWFVVRNTRGVTGFVGPGSDPTPLSEEEMLNLGFQEQSEPDLVVDFEVGDMITVIAGAWKDTVGAINPLQAVEFVLIILVVQQVDGNFIAPRIIGSATGLPGLGVLLAIIVGGNLFGIPGMVIGVPTLAVIVTLLREAVGAGLAARGIDEDGNPLSDIKN